MYSPRNKQEDDYMFLLYKTLHGQNTFFFVIAKLDGKNMSNDNIYTFSPVFSLKQC